MPAWQQPRRNAASYRCGSHDWRPHRRNPRASRSGNCVDGGKRCRPGQGRCTDAGIASPPQAMIYLRGPSAVHGDWEFVVRSFVTLPLVVVCAGFISACSSAPQQQPASNSEATKTLVGIFNPRVAAQQSYERSLADYQKCIAANPSNASACQSQRNEMEAAVRVLSAALQHPNN